MANNNSFDFEAFAFSTSYMPHIAANIISHLDIADVANCLKTNNAMRSFISNGLYDNRRLRRHTDRAVVNKAISKGQWTAEKTIRLPKTDFSGDSYMSMEMFCVDDSLFSTFKRGNKSADPSYGVDIYDKNGERTRLPSYGGFARAKVLACGKTLIDDGRTVMTMGEDPKQAVVVHKLEEPDSLNDRWDTSDTYDYASGEGQSCKITTFDERDGSSNSINLGAYLFDSRFTIHRQVRQ